MYLNWWVKDRICEQGMDHLKELAQVLLPGGSGKALINIKAENHPGNIKSCFTDFFNEWSERELEATWQKLIDALRGTNKHTLASDIENSLLTSPVMVTAVLPQNQADQQVISVPKVQQVEQMKLSHEPTIAGMHLASLLVLVYGITMYCIFR